LSVEAVQTENTWPRSSAHSSSGLPGWPFWPNFRNL